MKLELPTSKLVTETLELGDIVVHRDLGAYLVIEFQDNYVAKCLSGDGGLFGVYGSLEQLNEAFINRGTSKKCTIYKPNKYKLQLVEV